MCYDEDTFFYPRKDYRDLRPSGRGYHSPRFVGAPAGQTYAISLDAYAEMCETDAAYVWRVLLAAGVRGGPGNGAESGGEEVGRF